MRGGLVVRLAGLSAGRWLLCLTYWPSIIRGKVAELCPCGSCR